MGPGGPPRGSSFNTRNRVVLWGRVGGCVLAEVWQSGAVRGAGGRPCFHLPLCSVRVCVCVCVYQPIHFSLVRL